MSVKETELTKFTGKPFPAAELSPTVRHVVVVKPLARHDDGDDITSEVISLVEEVVRALDDRFAGLPVSEELRLLCQRCINDSLARSGYTGEWLLVERTADEGGPRWHAFYREGEEPLRLSVLQRGDALFAVPPGAPAWVDRVESVTIDEHGNMRWL